jgi:hypothetical protein
MRLRWVGSHDGSPNVLGYDLTNRLIGQVAWYDIVAGRGPGWVGYVHGNRVTGRCQTVELAQILVAERAPSAS